MSKRLFFLSVCSAFVLISGQCQMTGSSISGTGEVVKQEITLEALKGVNLGFSGDVILTHGTTQKIVLEGQQNILDNIKREVKNGVWGINFIKSVREARDVIVYVTLPTLEHVGLSGSGSIRSTNKFPGLSELELSVSGSGDITLDYDAKDTDLNISGSGEINLSGSSDNLTVGISGSGDVKASDLKTANCEVRITGSGDASVNASTKLDTHITGSGDVQYSGTASVNTKISGSGEVTKVN